MTARRIRWVRQRIRVARVVTPWNGLVAAVLLCVAVTAFVLGGFAPNLPTLTALYLAPVGIMAAAALGHEAARPRHALARVRRRGA